MDRTQIFSYAYEHLDRAVFVTESGIITFQSFLNEYERIRDKFVGEVTSHETVLLVFRDAVRLIEHYLTTAENGVSAVILSPDGAEEKIRELREKLNFSKIYSDCLPESDDIGTTHQAVLKNEIVLETSGTSGKKKLVRIDHEVFLKQMAVRHEYDADSEKGIKLLCVPIWHQIGIQEMIRAITFGYTLAVPPSIENAFIREMMAKNKITSVICKSSVLTRMIQDPDIVSALLQDVKVLRYCLEPLPVETLQRIQNVHKNLKLYSDYGITECVGTIAVTTPMEHLQTQDYHLPSIGKFLPGVEARIIDSKGQEIENNEIGELMVHTPALFNGYIGEERFDGYWVSTGDMAWKDEKGNLSISGFKKKVRENAVGTTYILPAIRRTHFVNLPFGFNGLQENDARWTSLQSLLMLLHGSLDLNEIKRAYLSEIRKLIPADAYGFEMLPVSLREHAPGKYKNDKWYQDAISEASHHKISIAVHTKADKVMLEDLETHYQQPVNILYVPLFSETSALHAAVSFARAGQQNDFTALEITMVKQITHHLNIALLNARAFQEIETRQTLFQETMEHMDVGIVVSDFYNTVYYMNDAAEKLLEEESRSSVDVSTILEKLKLSVKSASASAIGEADMHITYYKHGANLPVALDLRTIRMEEHSRFLVTFLLAEASAEQNYGDLEDLLTEKEKKVLNGLCRGLQYKEIADEMEISINTVNYHIKNIYQKMNVNSRTEALSKAMLLGGSGMAFVPGQIEE